MKICQSAQTGKYIRALLGYDMGIGSNQSSNMTWFEKNQTFMPVESVNHNMALMVKDVNVFDPRRAKIN